MKKGLVIAAGMMAALAAGPANAGEEALDLLDAPVAYTAHYTVSSDKGTFEGSVWHSPGRERREFATAAGGQAVLLRRDKDAAYLMAPSRKWYVGFGLHAAATLAGGLDGLTVERKRIKDETVAGLRATRYKVAASGGGGRFDGDAWFSKDGIMVKAAGTLTGRDGRAEQVETGLSEVRVGPVDEAMLSLPAGYFGLDLRSVPPENLQQAVEGVKAMMAGRGGRSAN